MTNLDKMARELLCSYCDTDSEDHYDEMPVTAAEAESAIRTALLTAPPGYVLVPAAPTPEMVDAAREHHEGEAYLPVSLYRTMIAAAPEPEA